MENEKIYNIIVAHAERQHSFYLAVALKKKGYLFKYITTIYDRPQSLTSRLKRFLRGNTLKKAKGRKCEELDDTEIVQFNEFFNLFITFLARFSKCRDLCRKLRNINGKIFGIKVAKYAIRNNVDAIIMFDSYAYSCFEYIKKKNTNIKCILDVTIMSRPYTRKVFDEISELTSDRKIKEENFYLYKEKYLENYRKEYRYGDFFLAGSEIVKKSIEFCGISGDRIAINPYGVNQNRFFYEKKDKVELPLHLIVVGQLNRRKGIHQLLDVVSRYNQEEVILDLVGGYEDTSDLYINYKDLPNVKFHGFITHDILYKLYHKAHVFVLPSFAEGMALVGLEALSSGLPLLCSDCTGINDLIIPYENGIVTRAGYQEDIKSGIDWFINNINLIPKMGWNARKTAEIYTWECYYNRTGLIIQYFMKNI